MILRRQFQIFYINARSCFVLKDTATIATIVISNNVETVACNQSAHIS